jgi:hypothetical protein
MSPSTAHTHHRLLPLLIALLFTFFLPSLVQAQATINSPASVTQCLPQQLTIAGGEPPYTITGSSSSFLPFTTRIDFRFPVAQFFLAVPLAERRLRRFRRSKKRGV